MMMVVMMVVMMMVVMMMSTTTTTAKLTMLMMMMGRMRRGMRNQCRYMKKHMMGRRAVMRLIMSSSRQSSLLERGFDEVNGPPHATC